MSLNDPEIVRRQYASEKGLAARSSLYVETTGAFAGDVAFDAIAEVSPERFLEVGCGPGWFSARVQRELGAAVIATDTSPRMLELATAEGFETQLADVQQLPFADGEFDAAAANWMLYHVPDVDRGLAELARVLRPGGRLVAITNGKDHLLELWRLVGAEDMRIGRHLAFDADNGAEQLERLFSRVQKLDCTGTVAISDRDAVVRYIESTEQWRPLAERVPERLEPFVARRSNFVFVADK